MSTTEAEVTKFRDGSNAPLVSEVFINKKRGGLPQEIQSLRKDKWWIYPVLTAIGLALFVFYGTWAAFRNSNYYVGSNLGRNYLSPFYSPCFGSSCPSHTFGVSLSWWTISPALLILLFPLGFRLTCYYYRKAYYRAYWQSPPGCSVGEPHRSYSGERKFPLVLNNTHRYFFYIAFLFALLLTYDALLSFDVDHSFGIAIGSLVFTINAVLIWLYTLGCHACRHVCGGRVNLFSKHKLSYKIWKKVLTPLNERHQLFAWLSLFWIAFADFYVWLVASGHITDFKLV